MFLSKKVNFFNAGFSNKQVKRNSQGIFVIGIYLKMLQTLRWRKQAAIKSYSILV